MSLFLFGVIFSLILYPTLVQIGELFVALLNKAIAHICIEKENKEKNPIGFSTPKEKENDL